MSRKIEYVRERTVFINGLLVTMTDDNYRILQKAMFSQIWRERAHICNVSNVPLTMDGRTYYFHHILEKRNYEKYALCKWNIIILSKDIHNSYESNGDNQPILKELKQSLLYKIDTLNYQYDNDVIFDIEQNSTTHITDIFGKQLFIHQ